MVSLFLIRAIRGGRAITMCGATVFLPLEPVFVSQEETLTMGISKTQPMMLLYITVQINRVMDGHTPTDTWIIVRNQIRGSYHGGLVPE